MTATPDHEASGGAGALRLPEPLSPDPSTAPGLRWGVISPGHIADQFTATATGIQGSGWAVLAWDSIGQRLNLFQMYDQQAGNIPLAQTPILQLDMWEHAFYLDYQNVKPDYVKAFWNIVNWADVQERFEKARTQTQGLIVPSAN